MGLKKINQLALSILFLAFVIATGIHFRNKKIETKSPEAISICNQEIKRVLTGIKQKSKDLSRLAKSCNASFPGPDCRELKIEAQGLIQILDGKDLGLRWQYFSCSPLLFSKLRQLRNNAESLVFLTILKKPTNDLLIQSKSILEPGMFIDQNMEDSQYRCCSKP